VTPLWRMLTGGGRSLEELRTLRNDAALARVWQQEGSPRPPRRLPISRGWASQD